MPGPPANHAGEERRRHLLAVIRDQGHLNVSAAATELGVSVETVRRDLSELEAGGLVRRRYGAAYPVESAGFETDLERRSVELIPEKRRIAIYAAQQLRDAKSVFIDEGYLPSLVARMLPQDRPLTVVTASLPVAGDLAARPGYDVILLGGRVRGRTLATVDHWVSQMLGGFSIDLAFIGANGISVSSGLTTPEPSVSEVKAVAVRVSRRRIFVGAHTKFTVTTFSRFASVTDFELLVTDTGLPASAARRFAALGPEVVRV